MDNKFLEIIKTRRSCRKFESRQIADDELEAVLEAGTYAPSAHGSQDGFIVAVQEKEMMERISAMNARVMGVESDPFYNAPTYILVFAPAESQNALQDGSCILENMMLAAHAIGLGTCWINREREMFATDEGKDLMKEMGLPDGLMGVGALATGYPAAPGHPAKPRKEGYVRIIK